MTDPTYLTEHEHKDIRQYREEYRNLQTREDILQEEIDNIDRKMIKFSQQLSVQNQQIDNIQNQEEKVHAIVFLCPHIDGRHIVFALSTSLFVCWSICLQKL